MVPKAPIIMPMPTEAAATKPRRAALVALASQLINLATSTSTGQANLIGWSGAGGAGGPVGPNPAGSLIMDCGGEISTNRTVVVSGRIVMGVFEPVANE